MIEQQHHLSSPKDRPRLYELDRRWALKFWLRLVTFIFTILGIVGFGIAASYFNGFGQGIHGLTINPRVPTLLPFIPLGISFLYNSLHFLLLLVRHLPPHPGLIVASDLILWTFLIVAAVLAILGGAFRWCTTYHGSLDCTGGSDKYNQAVWEIVGIVSLGICSLLHFSLFAIACHDTDLLRKRRKYASKAQTETAVFPTPYPPSVRASSSPTAFSPQEIYTPIEPTDLPFDRSGISAKEPLYTELESGQRSHPSELPDPNQAWPSELETQNMIPPQPRKLGYISEDNSPITGHPALGSTDKEFEARMQMDRDAENGILHPALRKLNAADKETRV